MTQMTQSQDEIIVGVGGDARDQHSRPRRHEYQASMPAGPNYHKTEDIKKSNVQSIYPTGSTNGNLTTKMCTTSQNDVASPSTNDHLSIHGYSLMSKKADSSQNYLSHMNRYTMATDTADSRNTVQGGGAYLNPFVPQKQNQVRTAGFPSQQNSQE